MPEVAGRLDFLCCHTHLRTNESQHELKARCKNLLTGRRKHRDVVYEMIIGVSDYAKRGETGSPVAWKTAPVRIAQRP